MDNIILLLFQLAILLFSIVIHEVSHGAMAYRLGDPTAKHMGRLTLNPIKHLDLWGSFLVPILLLVVRSPVLFGWAKPVPYNPYNLSNKKWGPAMVAAAGPGANIAIAIVFGLAIRFSSYTSIIETPAFAGLVQIFSLIVILNILLAVFNLVPIPPLDGSKLLFAVLPLSMEHIKISLERFGFMILLFFIFFAFRLILPIVFAIYNLIVGSGLTLF